MYLLLGAIPLCQQLFERLLHSIWFRLGTKPFDRISFMIHKELSKVPQDIRRSIFKRQGLLEKAKHLSRVGPIHITLFKKDQLILGLELALHKLQNFFVSSRFLLTKLVARKRQDFETLFPVRVDHIGQLCVISFRQTSFRGDVDDAKDVALILVHRDGRSVDEFVGQVVKHFSDDALFGSKGKASVGGLNGSEQSHLFFVSTDCYCDGETEDYG
mmetsp:Transcript_64297/g.96927  ORF Transcript_64297/g.96927 Transcript_64297/m.96927 type:complete len:215 (-) Transcript_64297:163-807(-)